LSRRPHSAKAAERGRREEGERGKTREERGGEREKKEEKTEEI